jgi:acetylglutamate kinase
MTANFQIEQFSFRSYLSCSSCNPVQFFSRLITEFIKHRTKVTRKIIIKIGGRAFEAETGLRELAEDIKSCRGDLFAIVHGGGAEITAALQLANRQPQFVDGLRITTAQDIEIVRHVLSTVINTRICGLLEKEGVFCQRMSGETDSLFLVAPLQKNGKSLGRVGQVIKVNPGVISEAWQNNHVPIISPISADGQGVCYNVNADSAAGALAAAIRCDDLVYFTDVAGVKNGDHIASRLSIAQAKQLIAQGTIQGGMIAKMESIFQALECGVKRVHVGTWAGKGTLHKLLDNTIATGTTIYSE